MTGVAQRLAGEPAVGAVRAALAGAGEEMWIVGGTVRDALLERPVLDVDVVVRGDPERAARAVARQVGGAVFPLSDAFGSWRAIDRAGGWFCDVSALQGESPEADLAQRDFTVNAMAVPLEGGDLIDPCGGLRDLRAGILRVLGVRDGSAAAYERDPLRPLRLVRLATELPLAPDAETERLTRLAAPRVTEASPERVFGELRRIMIAPRLLEGLILADRLGLMAAVLPELTALHDVEQSHFHHLDAHGHTLQVVSELLELEERLEAVFTEHSGALRSLLDEPLGDDLTRGQALRFGALLHDVGKPATRKVLPDGRVTFIGHDAVGEGMVSEICRRLRTGARLRRYVAALTRHHLVLGFLVHERPLSRRTVYRYLRACEPVEVEVTVLSCADRLATRGRGAEPAIAAHLELAAELMGPALEWRAGGPPAPLVRGDELAEVLGIAPGPELGELLRRLEEARFAGEAPSREAAIELARRMRQDVMS